jgi:AraC family transcriptional regulator
MNVQALTLHEQQRRFAQCRPFSVASFDIEASVQRPGFEIQVQRYRWAEPLSCGQFKPGVCYLDLALIPRVPKAEAAGLGTSPGRGPIFVSIGDCVFIPAEHEIQARNPGVEHRVLACMFLQERLQQYLDVEGSQLTLSACFNIKNPHIRTGLARLAEEVLAPGFASDLLVDSTINALIVELSRHFRGRGTAAALSGSGLPMRHVRLIQERLENASGAWPDLATLANECGISGRHLTRAFKNTTGRTLGEYVAEVRLRHAKQLLLDPAVLIKTIACQSGFRSQAAFAAAFRKATGWTPRRFRRESLAR